MDSWINGKIRCERAWFVCFLCCWSKQVGSRPATHKTGLMLFYLSPCTWILPPTPTFSLIVWCSWWHDLFRSHLLKRIIGFQRKQRFDFPLGKTAVLSSLSLNSLTPPVCEALNLWGTIASQTAETNRGNPRLKETQLSWPPSGCTILLPFFPSVHL